jgi:hypothetical protein
MNFRDLDARASTGMAVLIKGRSHGLNALIQLFTRSEYTHAGLLIRLGGMLFLAEMGAGGNHLVPLERYDDVPFDLYHAPVGNDPHGQDLWPLFILESQREQIRYDFMDLVRIALNNLLRLKLPRTDRGGLVCSAYVAKVFTDAGWQPPASMPSIPSPAALAAALGGVPVASFQPA